MSIICDCVKCGGDDPLAPCGNTMIKHRISLAKQEKIKDVLIVLSVFFGVVAVTTALLMGSM